MPRDTPPPIPKEILDQWYAKRRAERNANNPGNNSGNANNTPLGDRPGRPSYQPSQQHTTPAAPVEVKTVYEAAPQVRDLRKEAVSAFTPTAVQLKLQKSKGKAGLMEPEEADRLEKEGYLKAAPDTDTGTTPTTRSQQVTVEEVEDEDD